jgi:hypothetical protein
MNESRLLSFFGSKTIAGHLLRGAAAVALFAFAIRVGSAQPALSIIAGIGAIVMLRGCPMCWTLGLIETITRRFK